MEEQVLTKATEKEKDQSSKYMTFIIDALFASSSPHVSPRGKKIIETFSMDELTKRFN